MSKPSPLSRSSSSESLVKSSSHEIPGVEEQSKSTAPPIMKTKNKKNEQQLAYKTRLNTTHTQTNYDISKDVKEKIDIARKKYEIKALQWVKYIENINPDGVLNLSGFKSEGIQNLTEWLSSSPCIELTGLKLANKQHIFDEMNYQAAIALAKVIQTKNSITYLELTHSCITNEIINYLAQAIKSNPKNTITTLDFRNNIIGAVGAKAIAEILKNSSMITTLDLSNNYCGDEGAKAIAEILKTNTTITTLNLSNNLINDEGAKIIAEAIKANPNSKIATLNLSENSIHNEGAEAIAKALRNNTTISTLKLSYNKISNKGILAIAEAIKSNPNSKIATLNLSENYFGNEVANALAEMLKTNTTITTLDINSIFIDDEANAFLEIIERHCALNTHKKSH